MKFATEVKFGIRIAYRATMMPERRIHT